MINGAEPHLEVVSVNTPAAGARRNHVYEFRDSYPRAPAVKKTRKMLRCSVKVKTSMPRKDRMYTIRVVIL